MEITIKDIARRISILRGNLKASIAAATAAESFLARQEACRAASDDALSAAEYAASAGLDELKFTLLRLHEMCAGADAYGLTAYVHYRRPVKEMAVRSVQLDLLNGAKACLDAEIEADDDLNEAVKAYEKGA